MTRFAILIALMIAPLLAGCPATPEGPQVPGSRPFLPGADPNRPETNRYSLIIVLRMATIEVPVGMASGSEDIWSYVDEEPVAVGRSATLGRNGLRVGRGRGSSWEDVVKILKRLTGRSVQESQFVGLPGLPQHITLKEHQPFQTIFLSYGDQTLSGADYPPGDCLLSLACTLNEDDPSSLVVTGLPQIRSTSRRPQIVKNETGVAIVDNPVMFPFTPLTFQLSVPKSDFLVIGPGAEARRPSSVGHNFLVRQKEGMEFETVLIVMPEAIRRPER